MSLKESIKRKLNNFKYPIQEYVPGTKRKPNHMLEVVTAWAGLELIVEDILDRFNIGRESAIEFGVEFGYSSVVFSNYFKKVNGIDTFIGDVHTDHTGDNYEEIKNSLSSYDGIELFQSDYRDWIKKDDSHYDFAHVDIVHFYKETFECGLWAAQHSDCAIFHDTESFPEVRKAVIDIAKETDKAIFNYPFCNGLGIIVNKQNIK